jgi:hypothetical protein
LKFLFSFLLIGISGAKIYHNSGLLAEGQYSETGQLEQSGLRALQILRPWKMM